MIFFVGHGCLRVQINDEIIIAKIRPITDIHDEILFYPNILS